MKKAVGLVLILSLFIASACQKEQPAEVDNSTSISTETITRFQANADQFIADQARFDIAMDRDEDKKKKKKKRKWWKIVLKVVGADLTGGLGGALIGTAVPALGTVAGAIIGGAGASMTAGAGLEAGPGGPGGGNPDNIYDQVGEKHVNILASGLNEDREIIFDGDVMNVENYMNYAKDDLIANEMITAEQAELYTIEFMEENLTQAAEHSEMDMTAVILSFEGVGLISTEESEILHAYYSALEASESYEAFFDYSIGAEAIITDSEMTESEKELFLSTMSTTRHDFNYWKDVEME